MTVTPQTRIQPSPPSNAAPGRCRCCWRLLAAVQLALVPRPALAEDEAAGRRHWDRGQELYKQGRFLEAAREFEAGYQVAPRSNFLLNVGHSYRRAQELRKAKTAYETFLKIDPTSAHRPMVEDLIRTIDDALSAQSEPPVMSPRPAPPPTTPAPPPPGRRRPPPPRPARPPPRRSTRAPPPSAHPDRQPGPRRRSRSRRSIFRSPWFWGAVGAVLVAGVAGHGLRAQPRLVLLGRPLLSASAERAR